MAVLMWDSAVLLFLMLAAPVGHFILSFGIACHLLESYVPRMKNITVGSKVTWTHGRMPPLPGCEVVELLQDQARLRLPPHRPEARDFGDAVVPVSQLSLD